MVVTSLLSATERSGSRPAKALASIDLPAPGGPVKSRWCPPAAAISRARLGTAWSSMSARSTSGSAATSAAVAAGCPRVSVSPRRGATSPGGGPTGCTGRPAAAAPAAVGVGGVGGQGGIGGVVRVRGVRGGQVDRRAVAGERKARVSERRGDSFASLLDRLVSEPDDAEGRQTRGDVGLDVHTPGLDAVQARS